MTKRKKTFDTSKIVVLDNVSATLMHKPKFNGYGCGHGVHGDTTYNRGAIKRRFKKELEDELWRPLIVCRQMTLRLIGGAMSKKQKKQKKPKRRDNAKQTCLLEGEAAKIREEEFRVEAARELSVPPLFGLYGRAANCEDDDLIRASFMVWDEGYRAHTSESSRPVLNELARTANLIADGVTKPCVTIVGVVGGVSNDDGSLGIWISKPRGRCDNGEIKLVDDHIWLFGENARTCKGDSLILRYGETVAITAVVKSYDYKGRKRLGFCEWTVEDKLTEYFDMRTRKRIKQPEALANPESVVMRVKFSSTGMPEDVWIKPESEFVTYKARLAELWANTSKVYAK